MKICDLYNTESNPKFGAKLIKIFLFYIVFECHYEESSREKEFSLSKHKHLTKQWFKPKKNLLKYFFEI